MRGPRRTGWVLQEVTRFTVEICALKETPRTLGTGFLVTPAGHVVTCARVVARAGVPVPGVPSRRRRLWPWGGSGADAAIGVRLPPTPPSLSRPGREREIRTARILAGPGRHKADLLLLALDGPALQLGPDEIALLGAAEHSAGHPFVTFGYDSTAGFRALHAHGVVTGPAPRPAGGQARTLPVRLATGGVRPGMSGAPVLDTTRNLVVAVIDATAAREGADGDTGLAVDAAALTEEPFGLTVTDVSGPGRGPEPSPLIAEDARSPRAAPACGPTESRPSVPTDARPVGRMDGRSVAPADWDAPVRTGEWIPRPDLTVALTRDWEDPDVRVVALHGPGGAGKTTAARQFAGTLARSRAEPLDGVFWWSFHRRPSADEFLEQGLAHLGTEPQLLEAYRSARARAALFVARLNQGGAHLFVLDGLETMQFTGGEAHGRIGHDGLRDWLRLVAAPTHGSRCLITTRYALPDLATYLTHRERRVGGLARADGRRLLRALGVGRGTDAELDSFVERCAGHPYALALAATITSLRYGGDAARLAETLAPGAVPPLLGSAESSAPGAVPLAPGAVPLAPGAEALVSGVESSSTSGAGSVEAEEAAGPQRLVAGLLTAYEPLLSVPQRELLTRASVFRGTVTAEAVGAADHADLARLRELRLIQPVPGGDGAFVLHPLVRRFHLDRTAREGGEHVRAAHARAQRHYERLAARGARRTLTDLCPAIEAFHHARETGDVDRAYALYRDLDRTGPAPETAAATAVRRGEERPLTSRIGAYELDLALATTLFTDDDLAGQPRPRDPGARAHLWHETGLCLMTLGHLADARPLFAHAVETSRAEGDTTAAVRSLLGSAELALHLGDFTKARCHADAVLGLLPEGRAPHRRWRALAHRARAEHLAGETDAASADFALAERIQQGCDTKIAHLHGPWGVWYAEHLRLVGDHTLADEVTVENLRASEAEGRADVISQCRRVLGDLAVDRGGDELASLHYAEALRIAERVPHRRVLIEALLARGAHFGRTGDPERAFGELQRAVTLADEGGYRVHSAGARIGLADVFRRLGHDETARRAATAALDISRETGHVQGERSAAATLARLEGGTDGDRSAPVPEGGP